MRSPLLALLCALSLLGAAAAQAPLDRPSPPPAKERKAAAPRSASAASLLQPDIELIDVPTAGVLDQGGFSSRTRFFSQGGVMEWLNFGVFPRVNLGASLNVDKLIGTSSPVQLTRPDLQLKYRFYDGDRRIPALVLGFDGQGYLYNRPDKRYDQRQRGLYLVGTQEVGLPGLQAHAGMNISDFDANELYGMLASSLNIQDKVLFMCEWDNLSNYVDSRFNLGLRVYLIPSFHMDFSARGIGQGGDYSNGVSRGPERVVQFKYTSSF